MLKTTKKVKMFLLGPDGKGVSATNLRGFPPHVLLHVFNGAAKRQAWPQEDIQEVLDECMSGNYDHLLATLAQVCETEDEGDDGGDDEDVDDDEEDEYEDELYGHEDDEDEDEDDEEAEEDDV